MERKCEHCHKPFTAQRSTARYCSSTCRANNSLGVAPVPLDTSAQADSTSESSAGLVQTLETELATAGVLETSEGQAALILARRIQAGSETGSSMAALSKQMVALKGEALASVSKRDQMDEVTRRRDAKMRAARLGAQNGESSL